jgi:ATP-binding cassette subfamily C protein
LLDGKLATTIHQVVVRLANQGRSSESSLPVRDLDQIRSFLTSPGPIAVVDLPWMPVFLALCFLIHPWLGLLACAGAVILFALTLLTERASRQPTRAVMQQAAQRSALVEASRRNSESAIAMGMTGTLATRWASANQQHSRATQRLSDVVGSHSVSSRVVRLMMQSAIYGLGSYLVIQNELTAGAMIAASIMMGRALAPIEIAIANWRGFVGARQSVSRLSELLARYSAKQDLTRLPPPQVSLDVENLIVAPPNTQKVVVSDVKFRIEAGDALGIIGPSGAGKTSLVRTIVGIWQAARGTVRLDGAALENWDVEELGRHIGFVSQYVDLFDGTVAENIARMQSEPDPQAVLEAAKLAGAHEMILRLPDGYDTRIGDAGAVLSGGQRQRVALARALYGRPFLVALDEPNSNLDNEGEQALQSAIRALKSRGAIVVLVAHRPSALAECDKVLLLNGGKQQMFGPRDEVLRQVFARPAPVQPAAAQGAGNLKVVHAVPAGAAHEVG